MSELPELLRRRASDYELLAAWHVERSADDPAHRTAADALAAVAIVLREIADAVEGERLAA